MAAQMDDYTSKVVMVPFTKQGKKKGDKPTNGIMRCGIRCQLGAGEWFFFKFRTVYVCSDGIERKRDEATEWASRGEGRSVDAQDRSTWTRHRPGALKTYRSGSLTQVEVIVSDIAPAIDWVRQTGERLLAGESVELDNLKTGDLTMLAYLYGARNRPVRLDSGERTFIHITTVAPGRHIAELRCLPNADLDFDDTIDGIDDQMGDLRSYAIAHEQQRNHKAERLSKAAPARAA